MEELWPPHAIRPARTKRAKEAHSAFAIFTPFPSFFGTRHTNAKVSGQKKYKPRVDCLDARRRGSGRGLRTLVMGFGRSRGIVRNLRHNLVIPSAAPGAR